MPGTSRKKTAAVQKRGPIYLKTPKLTAEMYEQGAFLALTSILCHIMGIAIRIYTTNIFGDLGNNYFACAYDIFTVFLLASSYCLPNAVAEMSADCIASGRPKRAVKILQAALLLAGAGSAAAAGLMYLGAGLLASTVLATPYAVFSLRILCIALLFSAVSSVIRGFLQGTGVLFPSALSQLVEQVVRTLVTIGSCLMLYNYGNTIGTVLADTTHYSAAFGATSAAYGVLAGSIGSFFILIILLMVFMKSFRKLTAKDTWKVRDSYPGLMGSLFTASVPLFLTTFLTNFGSILSQGVFKKIGDLQGYTEDNLAVLWGIYAGKYKMIMAIPVGIAFAAAASNAGKIIAAKKEKKLQLLCREMSRGVRFTLTGSIPFMVWLAVFLTPFFTVVFPGTSSTLELSVNITRAGLIGILIYAWYSVTSAYLHYLGRYADFIQNAVFSLVVRILMLILLMLFLRMNIYAVLISYLAFGFIMCCFNMWSLYRFFGYKQELVRSFLLPLFFSGIATGLSYGVYYLFLDSTDNMIASLLIAMCLAALIYLILAIFGKCITEEDLGSSPVGRTMKGIFRKLHLM